MSFCVCIMNIAASVPVFLLFNINQLRLFCYFVNVMTNRILKLQCTLQNEKTVIYDEYHIKAGFMYLRG